MDSVRASDIERVFREEHGRAVSVLVRIFGDIDLAEEAVQDAFAAAVEHWPRSGVPAKPASWIITTARNRTIDRLRRGRSRGESDPAGSRELDVVGARLDDSFDEVGSDDLAPDDIGRVGVDPLDTVRVDRVDVDPHDVVRAKALVRDSLVDERTAESEEDPMRDDQLRLIFLCCHPALAPDVRVAMTLRLVGGLTTPEIARAFLVPEATMAQRLVRAKAKVRQARIPYRVPDENVLPTRIDAVLAVVYLIFNEGYASAAGKTLVRDDLCGEAIRLGRLLARWMPDDAEVTGLLALMLLSESRRATRTSADGDLVLLADQDREQWDRALIAEGHALVRRCLRRNDPGPYQIQAAINAVHCDAHRASDTDWKQIVALYDRWMSIAPTPIVALNRAVAVAEVDGAEVALAIVDALELDHYAMFHAIRGDLLRRLRRTEEAVLAYDAAIARTSNTKEREFLERRRRSVDRDC